MGALPVLPRSLTRAICCGLSRILVYLEHTCESSLNSAYTRRTRSLCGTLVTLGVLQLQNYDARILSVFSSQLDLGYSLQSQLVSPSLCPIPAF